MGATAEVTTALLAERSAERLRGSVYRLPDPVRDASRRWEVSGATIVTRDLDIALDATARSSLNRTKWTLGHIALTASPVVVAAIADLLAAIARSEDLAAPVARVADALGVRS